MSQGGTVNTCADILYDSGGQGATGYLDNENYTLTICPDNPGDAITLDFLNFALSTTNTATPPGNNADNISIYDGDNTGAPTLGTYTGNQLQGLLVSCTSLNTTGCITLVFNSNDAGTGVFAANITCTTPCQRPTVSMVSPIVPNNPVKICDGDDVTFDGSASFAAPGFNIVQYIWDFNDGTTDTTSGSVVTHTFNQGANEHSVNLYVIDDNNCISTNLETINVQVSTIPTFTGTANDTTLCLGENVCMDGIVNSTTYTGNPISSLGGATYLPDDVGQCFSADLTFQNFNPGQTLTNVNDLLNICVNMEHSYMGDLVATIYCPNGQSVIMHQQNGGGTNLGDPNQLDDSTLIGDCWQYCWSPTATNGTWEDNSQFGANPNTVVNSSGSNSLVAGTYESLNPLSDLVGCPLNGTWTIEFCDLWGSDDGFVCDWTMDFNPALYPPLTTFTPVFGLGSDSSEWVATGQAATFITSTSGNSNQICINPTTTGAFDYTFEASNDYGCTFDTTITITVGTGPTVDAGNDTSVCLNGTVQLEAIATGGIASAPTCDYTIQMLDDFGDGWNGFTIEVFINGVSQGTHTLNTGSAGSSTFPISDGDQISITTISGVFDSEVTYEIYDCDGNLVTTDGVNVTGNAPIIGANIWNGTAISNVAQQYQYNWTPATDLSATNIFNPVATVNGNITYVVEAWETNHQVCSSFDTINISLFQAVNAGLDGAFDICWNDPPQDMFPSVGGTPDLNGVWAYDPTNTLTTNMFDPTVDSAGVYNYIVPGQGVCPGDTAEITVNVLQLGNPACGCPLDLTLTSTNPLCFGSCDGTITLTDPFANEFSIDNGLTWQVSNVFNGLCVGMYTLKSRNLTWGAFCQDSITVELIEPTELTLDLALTHNLCFGDCNGTGQVTLGGGTPPYSYNWSNGQTVFNATAFCAGTYNVIGTDNNGCTIDSLNFVITETPEVTVDVVNGIAETCFEYCDGTIDITGVNSHFYSNDGGLTFQSSNSFTNLCDGIYNIVIQDSNNCQATDVIELIGPDQVIAEFSANPQPTTVENTLITVTNQSQNATTFNWDFAGLGSSIDENTSFDFPQVPGTHQICLTASEGVCTDSICHDIIINDILIVYVPNSITPNNDGVNDMLIPVISGHREENYEFYVFDRWGEVVFFTESSTEAWNGRVNGRDAKMDVYTWKLKVVSDHDGSKKEFYGHCTIVK